MRKTPLKKMSKAKIREHRKYILARARALPGKVCEYPGSTCTNQADDVHHSHGRAGAMLNDQRHWWFLCRQHHSWLHSHTRDARKLGLLK